MGASGAEECGENPVGGKLMKNVRTKFDSKQLSEGTDLVQVYFADGREVGKDCVAPMALDAFFEQVPSPHGLG